MSVEEGFGLADRCTAVAITHLCDTDELAEAIAVDLTSSTFVRWLAADVGDALRALAFIHDHG